MKIFEVMYESHENDFIKSFLPFVQKQLDIKHLPTIKVMDRIPGTGGTTFGCFKQEENTIYLVTKGRHPKDAMRTLAHELVHYKQDVEDRLNNESGATGSPEENEANAQAGIIMRNFNQANPE